VVIAAKNKRHAARYLEHSAAICEPRPNDLQYGIPVSVTGVGVRFVDLGHKNYLARLYSVTRKFINKAVNH